MIEKEAREKTCPFIQHATLVVLSAKSDQVDAEYVKDKHIPSNINCIGTGCMAWVEAAWINDKSDGYCKLIGDI